MTRTPTTATPTTPTAAALPPARFAVAVASVDGTQHRVPDDVAAAAVVHRHATMHTLCGETITPGPFTVHVVHFCTTCRNAPGSLELS